MARMVRGIPTFRTHVERSAKRTGGAAMRARLRPAILMLLGTLWLAGCAVLPPVQPAGPGQESTTSTGPKRVKGVVVAELPTLISKFDRVLAGSDTVEQMVSAGLALIDDTGTPRAQLAQEIPSVANGLWKVSPDGSMETTWRLKPGLTWHDGSPFSTDDLAFTLTAARDPDVVSFRRTGYDLIQNVAQPDAQTLVIQWRGPFIEADQILSPQTGTRFNGPLPLHLLGRPYQENKAGILDLSYWSTDYVGTGPYKLKQWVPGSFFVLQAFDGYALGRPKIDEFEVQFSQDANAAISRILSGEAEVLLGRGLDLTQATDAAARWPDGKMDYGNRIA